jgi:hypothetical protein
MKFVTHSHRNAEQILATDEDYASMWAEVQACISSLTDESLKEHFKLHNEGRTKSISLSINALLKQQFQSLGWNIEPRIFGEPSYSQSKRDKKWRLDFSKNLDSPLENALEDELVQSLEPTKGIALEVAFNNDGSTAWNLIKPVLASELNHVKKDLQTSIGIIITATESLKNAGGFDNAVGTFEDFKLHLRPMRSLLTVPILLIGLEPPSTFTIQHKKIGKNNYGYVVDN